MRKKIFVTQQQKKKETFKISGRDILLLLKNREQIGKDVFLEWQRRLAKLM